MTNKELELFELICDVNVNAHNVENMGYTKLEALCFIRKHTDDCIKENPELMKEGNRRHNEMMAKAKKEKLEAK